MLRISAALFMGLVAACYVPSGPPAKIMSQGVVPVVGDGDQSGQLDRMESMLNKLIKGQAGLSDQLTEIKDGADRNTDRLVEAILSLKQDPPKPEPDPTIQPKIEYRTEYQQVCENGVCRMVEIQVPYTVQDVTPVEPDEPMDPGYDEPMHGQPACRERLLFNGRFIHAWRNIRARLLNRRVARFNARWR